MVSTPKDKQAGWHTRPTACSHMRASAFSTQHACLAEVKHFAGRCTVFFVGACPLHTHRPCRGGGGSNVPQYGWNSTRGVRTHIKRTAGAPAPLHVTEVEQRAPTPLTPPSYHIQDMHVRSVTSCLVINRKHAHDEQPVACATEKNLP